MSKRFLHVFIWFLLVSGSLFDPLLQLIINFFVWLFYISFFVFASYVSLFAFARLRSLVQE